MELDRIVEGLRRPEAYPHPVQGVEVRRTHISVVFLAGGFAYKVKKPVTLDFLDYGTLERRRRFCREEVRLNRRLAPDVYRGVVPVVLRDGELRLEPDADRDEAVEWAVRMRRLPDDRTLEALLERGVVGEPELAALARRLADFHREARRGPDVARFGRFDVVAKNTRDNLSQSTAQIGETLDGRVFERLSSLVEAALAAARPRIELRAARGIPCDTHGDLRLDHVYFLDGGGEPTIIDCIEFNEAFRFADPVADTAFLAMDLERAGRRDLSGTFADAYFDAADDPGGRALLGFYVAYRAAVRGKVQGIKAAAGDVSPAERERAARTATGHWLLALGALATPAERPGLVLVGGLPGTGKTTLARGLAERAGFTVLRSDVVRKELAGLRPHAPADAGWGEGLYTPEWSERTYEACRRRAEEILLRGGRVAVDASFHAEARRVAFVETAHDLGVRVAMLVCEAEPAAARERLAGRTGDASDADPDVHEAMAARWDAPGPAVERVTAAIRTGGPPASTLRRALEALQRLGLA